MSVRLTVKQRSEAGGGDQASEVLLNEPRITLGRDKACDVVLAQRAVSRTHARISRDGALFFLEDLGSAYGTQINGKSLPKGEKRLLRNGDVIAIAQFDVTFDRIADKPQGGTSEKTSFVARQVVRDAMRGLGKGEDPYLRVMNGPREGEHIPIADAQELVIGRDDGADIVFDDDLVSRKHVKVRRDWSGIHVEDLGSRNGIKVNKKRVSRKTLKDQDELEVGGVRLLFLDPSEVREAAVILPDEEVLEEGESTGHVADAEVEPEPEPVAEGAPAEPPPEAEPEPVGEEALEAPPSELADAEPLEQAPEEEELEDAALEPGGFMGLVRGDRKRLVPFIAMVLFALFALVLIIALFAGM